MRSLAGIFVFALCPMRRAFSLALLPQSAGLLAAQRHSHAFLKPRTDALHRRTQHVLFAKQERTARAPANVDGDESRSSPSKRSESHLRKRKVALVIGYVGSEFSGLQIQRAAENHRTVEGALEEALFAAGAISPDNYQDLNKIGWRRTSRTDKGVHAARSVVVAKLLLDPSSFDSLGMSTSARDSINSFLPPDICVFSVCKVPGSFRGRPECTFRDYEYYFPCEMIPGGKQGLEHFSSILKEFVGSHSFHNYCTMKEKRLKEAQRHIMSLRDENASFKGEPTSDRVELRERVLLQELVTTVYKMDVDQTVLTAKCDGKKVNLYRVCIRGQGFLYNQIRFMVGSAIAEAAGVVPRGTNAIALHTPYSIDLFRAPAEGLVLTSQGFTASSNCAVIEPGMLNYLPGQLTLWGPDGSSTDNLRSKGRAQSLMCPESLELSSVFMTEDILPRIASDWATSLGDAWLQEIDQRVQESYSDGMLELFGIEGSKRLAAIKEAEAEEIKRHNASRKKAFESTVNRKRLKEYLPRGLTTSLVSKYGLLPGEGVAAVQKALIRRMATPELRDFHGGRSSLRGDQGLPQLEQDADIAILHKFIDDIGIDALLQIGGFRSCLEGVSEADLRRLGAAKTN